ncbi:MAG: UbiA family prenyltransferase, partial [Phycisphaerales bacterium]|nr:UbiA family prenyltransferase [Phycisphaerales bacterium]
MTIRARAHAWLELARISNLPTVWTNALVGVALGSEGVGLPAGRAGLAVVALSFLYIGGMVLNDAFDATRDASVRSGRPIPSGRIGRVPAFAVGGTLLALGVATLTPAGPMAIAAGGALAAVILLYDWLHHLAPITVALMGVCRGGAYVVAAAAAGGVVDSRGLIVCAVGMTVYVIALTVLARSEHTSERRAGVMLAGVVLPVPLLAAAVLLPSPVSWAAPTFVAVVLAGWIWHATRLTATEPPQPVAAVMGWLAAICLADVLFLVRLDEPVAAAVAAGCFV